jgi:hypothetical protein
MFMMRICDRCLRTSLLLAGLLAAGGCATASRAPSNVDPAARAEVDRMRAALGGLVNFRMKVESVTDETLPSGRLVQVGRTTEIKVAKPDRLAVAVVRDSGQRWSAWLSGGKFVLLDEREKRFARIELPKGIDAALDELGDRYGLFLPLADFVSDLKRDDLLTRVQSGLYVGVDTVAGKECSHVLFRQPVADWQAWIETGEPALPRRILMTYKDEPGDPGYDATIVEWDTAPRFDEGTWSPQLPPDAREIGIDELLGQE